MASTKGLSKAIDQTDLAPENYRWQKEKEQAARKVKGRFINRECPGGEHTFHFREFKGERVATYTLRDGEDYELPLGVVKHLLRCQVEEDTNDVKLVDPYTFKPLYQKKLKPRFAFVTSEFFE